MGRGPVWQTTTSPAALHLPPVRSCAPVPLLAALPFLLAVAATAAPAEETLPLPAAPADVPQYLQERPVTRLDEPTRWAICSWDPEKDDRLAECATVVVPADADPARGMFRLLVKRRRVIGRPQAQVWILHGGPGASATEGMKRLSYDIPELRPRIAYYAVDHRGTGGSEKLECPEEQRADSPKGSTLALEEWPACIAHLKETLGTRLGLFTTTHSARDVGTLVEKYREPGVPVFLYGASYGTYLARRYLQVFPKQPRGGVILEGIAASRDHMTGYDAAMIRATDALLGVCARSPACGSRFDASPVDAVRRTLASLDGGHCPGLGMTTADAKAVLTGMTFSAPTRVLVPALARRITRCAAGDVPIVQKALAAWLASFGGKGSSSVLHNHVALSEMYTPAQTTEELQRQADAAALTTGLELGYSRLFPLYPRYERDQYVGQEPVYDGPLLMLQGGLDTPSPLPRALPVRDRFRGRHQYWVQFPEGAHGMTSKTPTADGSDCGRSIYLQFIDHPDRRPDTGCLARILPIDWNSNPDDALRFLGTIDIWDGGLQTPSGDP